MAVVYKQTGKKLKAIEYLERALEVRRIKVGDISL